MTEQEKQLLLVDLCARVPYRTKVFFTETIPISTLKSINAEKETCIIFDHGPWYKSQKISIKYIKPYLRPMSSMSSEEKSKYNLKYDFGYAEAYNEEVFCATSMIDFFNAHHLDYRGLIPKGLALEAPKDMYEIPHSTI